MGVRIPSGGFEFGQLYEKIWFYLLYESSTAGPRDFSWAGRLYEKICFYLLSGGFTKDLILSAPRKIWFYLRCKRSDFICSAKDLSRIAGFLTLKGSTKRSGFICAAKDLVLSALRKFYGGFDLILNLGRKRMGEFEHPHYYNRHPSGVECITIIQHFPFCIGAAMKYLWRAGLKSPDLIEDLRKAIHYIQFEIYRLEAEAEEEGSD